MYFRAIKQWHTNEVYFDFAFLTCFLFLMQILPMFCIEEVKFVILGWFEEKTASSGCYEEKIILLSMISGEFHILRMF